MDRSQPRAQEGPLRSGSAVVVAPGRLVTNCQGEQFLVRQDNVTYGAMLEYPDVERDLCQIKVANFRAAPVQIAPAGAARVGQKVYAIGSPRGVENTLSEGILTGLRGGDSAEARLLQTTAPLSDGSSGGGLFDSEGAGCWASPARAGRCPWNSSPRLPRGPTPPWRRECARRRPTRPVAPQARAPGACWIPGAPAMLEYVRTDKMTGNRTPIIYRLDRISGDELSFNMGGPGRACGWPGRVGQIAGRRDLRFSSPPGGWVRKDMRPGMRWSVDYVASTGEKWRHALDAVVVGERPVRVDGTELRVVQIGYTGWIYASYGTGASAVGTRFEANAWYSPELGRVVRFEAEHRRGNANTTFESLELVRILR
ncbi:MAG: serine protease [Variovorax sp.]|nr:MAG: serine protease [Variovorax sp.]